MTAEETTLTVAPREVEGSRSVRRLRRSGLVPGIVYGGGEDPVAFQVDARALRVALADAGAVITLDLEGGQKTPVVLKDQQRHPVTGDTLHIDLLRVDLTQRIHATVVLELTGADDAPGVRLGGVLEQVTRELIVEALPTEIPDAIHLDVATAEIGDIATLEAITAPAGVVLLDPPETVIFTLSPPRLSTEAEDEIEQETEVVGAEGEAPAEGESGGE